MASESPPRKRAKLSLKFSKSQKLFDSPTKSMRKLAVSSENDTKSGSDSPVKDECTGKSPVQNVEAEHPPEPYVGFYNIGNTCYLNSVLQALRYCPQFVETLQMLSEIGGAWLDQRSGASVGAGDKDSAGDLSGRDATDAKDVENISGMLKLLKEMHKIYDLMRDKEDNFLLMPSSDTDMAINPEMVLEALRVVNPMFEGYFQHDAQELLCTLLSTLKEVQEKLSKDLRLGDKDAINNNNIPPFTMVCRTPTVTKAGGSLKGGCSPSISRSLKRCLQSGSPSAARKHLCYPSAGGDAAEETEPVSTMTESPDCNGSGDGGKGKKFRRKSMRNRQIERQKKVKTSAELPEEEETPKEVKSGKKKSLGIKRLCKLPNQPTILSKLGILRKKKLQDSSPTSSLESKPSQQQTLSEEAGSKGASVRQTETDSKQDSPPQDSQVKEHSCNTPAVAFQRLERSEGLFQGSLVLRTKCLECENHTERCEEFQDVSVPVHCLKKLEEEEDSELQTIEPPSESNDSCDVDVPQQVSLDWALSEFTLGERLSDTNKYFCDSCLHLTEAERFLLFDALPQVMVIHLKRFSSIQHTFSPGGSIPKLNDLMETPMSITMDRWCTKSCQQRLDTYRLLSVVSHTGTSSSSGHYLSYIRVPKLEPVCTEDGEPREVTGSTDQYQWVLFDDDNVVSLSDEEFQKCINNPSNSEGDVLDTPYLLFYSRQSMKETANEVK